MQFSSTGQDIKFSFYYKITQITPVNNMQVYCEYMDIENWGAMKRTPHVLRSIKASAARWAHWKGADRKWLTGNDCVNCCTWSVSRSPARSTCLNPSHPNLICTLTPYTSWMDPDRMTPPTVVAKRYLNSVADLEMVEGGANFFFLSLPFFFLSFFLILSFKKIEGDSRGAPWFFGV